jgi:hypothetical protein
MVRFCLAWLADADVSGLTNVTFHLSTMICLRAFSLLRAMQTHSRNDRRVWVARTHQPASWCASGCDERHKCSTLLFVT